MVQIKTLVLLAGSVGSGAIGVIAILAALVGFGGEDYYKDDPIGVEMGLKFEILTGEISVWMRAPYPLFTFTRLSNIYKIEDGEKSKADLTSLIPSGDTKTGQGQIDFEIYSTDDANMPDLRSLTQTIVPAAYIKKSSKLPTIVRYIMIMNAACFNNWGIVKFLVVSSQLGLIMSGIALLGWNKVIKKDKTDAVEDLKEDSGDGDD